MKKFVIILIIIISSAVLLYGVFVGVDCVRLYNADESKPPIIITKPTKIQDDEVKYTGLGYTVIYKTKAEIPTEENESKNAIYDICGAEFRLFDKILLWAWIADADMDVEKFSYEKERLEIGEGVACVTTKDFHYPENFDINNKEQAIKIAKKEATVEYDSVYVAFDEKEQMWKVNFYKDGYFGGDQTVYLNKDGTTQICVWGE